MMGDLPVWFSLGNVLWASVVAGGIGLASSTLAPRHHSGHWVARSVVWAGAVLLVACVGYLFWLFRAVSACVGVPGDSGSFLVNGVAFTLSCLDDGNFRTFVALSPWQTGIGAGLGLLGLAWSTLYRSVYDDWKKHQALSWDEYRKLGTGT